MFSSKITLLILLLIFATVVFSQTAQTGKPASASKGDAEFDKKNYVAALEAYRTELAKLPAVTADKRFHLDYKIGLCMVRLQREQDYREQFEKHIADYLTRAAGTIWEPRGYYLKGLFQPYAWYGEYDQADSVNLHPFEKARQRYNPYLKDKNLWPGEVFDIDFELAKVLEQSIYQHDNWYNEKQVRQGLVPDGHQDDIAELEKKERESLAESNSPAKAEYSTKREVRQRLIFLYREMEKVDFPNLKDLENLERGFKVKYNLANFLRRQARTDVYRLEALKLLRTVRDEAKAGKLREDAHYILVLHHQQNGDLISAKKEAEALIKDFPKSRWVSDCRAVLQEITKKELSLQVKTVFLPGQTPDFMLTSRNLDKVELSLRPLDLVGFLEKNKNRFENQYLYNLEMFGGIDKALDYAGKPLKTWAHKTSGKDDFKIVADSLAVTLEQPLPMDCYLLLAEASQVRAAALIIVTDLAMVQRTAGDKSVVFMANAITGAPVAGAQATIIQADKWQAGQTDADGLFQATLVRNNNDWQYNQIACFGYLQKRVPDYKVLQVNTAVAVSPQSYRNYYDDQERLQSYTITDRTVYRPKQTVYFKHLFRENKDGVFFPATNRQIQISINNPKGEVVLDSTYTANEFGSIAGSYAVPDEAPLGAYNFQIRANGNWIYGSNAQFRVEEYKRPEVKLNILADEATLKVGQTAKVTLQAEYYFGGGVPDAEVSYTIKRRNYRPSFYAGNDYDWLYGRGFADVERDRGWWWQRWWYYDWQETVVKSGTAKTDATGEVKVDVPTADLLSDDWDDAYMLSVDAHVTDASRRQVDAHKEFVLPVQEFYAHVTCERNFLLPNEKAKFTIQTLTPNYAPYDAGGEVQIFKLIEKNTPPAPLDRGELTEDPYIETKIFSEKLKTVAGRAEYVWIPKEDGRFRVKFRALDAREKVVIGQTELWVAGEKFAGRTYRFSGLSVTTDKGTYAEGETAHLLLTVERENSHVFLTAAANNDLFSADVIAVSGRAKTIPLKITAQHVPNFFLTGYALRDGKVLTDNRQVFVPPAKHFINVELAADKTEYKPGETGKFSLKTTDSAGQPIASEVSLSVFDASLLYIAPDLTPDIRRHFYGSLRNENVPTVFSLDYAVYPKTEDKQEYKQYEGHGYPAGWYEIGEMDDLAQEESGVGYGRATGGAMVQKNQTASVRVASAPAPAMAAMEMAADAVATNGKAKKDGDGRDEKEVKPDFKPEIRADFSETVLWRPFVVTDKNGLATVECKYSDALTTWQATAKAITTSTQVGEATTTVRTKKDILVRLQAPRFFVEKDEVVLSANVHNYSTQKQSLNVKLELEGGTLEPFENKTNPRPPAIFQIENALQLEPNSEKRLDWRVKVTQSGAAKIRVTAASKTDGDAMEMTFPVIAYGIEKMVAQLGELKDGAKTANLTIAVPDEIRPGSQSLTIQLNPSLAAITIDALPYLADYPYGCFEQTMSRFVPAALTAKTLQDLGLNLRDLQKARKNIMAEKLAAGRWHHRESPVFDDAELRNMITAGLERLMHFQKPDGGFGWWTNDGYSDPYMTAHGLNALLLARACDLNVSKSMLSRAADFLANHLKTHDNIPENLQAYAFYAISNYDPKTVDVKALDKIYNKRDKLSYYSWALLGLTYTNIVLDEMGQFKPGNLAPGSVDKPLINQKIKSAAFEKMVVLRENLLDRIKTDENNGAKQYYWQPEGGYWWYWWNDRIETTATALQFLNRVDPQNEALAGVVRWLVNNRRGNRWNSTKDTALAVSVLLEYARTHGELSANYTLTVKLDGAQLKAIEVTPQNLLTFDNQIVAPASGLKPGAHQIEITKDGKGSLYYAAFVEYFTKEDPIKGTGNELYITRDYYRLNDVPPGAAERGELTTALKNGDILTSGEEIEVVLRLDARNDYEYLVFEDMKPAGCEFTIVQSQGGWMELRDEKAVFFRNYLQQGKSEIRYRLRAETPGIFHALPTDGRCMYAPDVRGISDSFVVGVEDK